MTRTGSDNLRRIWVRDQLQRLPTGSLLLDVGAGECQYKPWATHLKYTAQDFAQYDGKGNGVAVQNGAWDTSNIDIVCDILDIPEDTAYDALLCSEVLEHIPEPSQAVRKMAKLLRPGGTMILTAPFFSIVHQAPYYFSSGFSRYWYEHHLATAGLEVVEMVPSGGYFDLVAQEVRRAKSSYKTVFQRKPNFLARIMLRTTARLLERWAAQDSGKSNDIAAFRWMVVARKTH